MTHSDDDGLVLPPCLAPLHIVILPLVKSTAEQTAIMEFCATLKKELQAQDFCGNKLLVKIDTSDARPGEKAWGWVKKGVPIRIEVGARELASNNISIGRRDGSYTDKVVMPKEKFVNSAVAMLHEIQQNLLTKAKQFKAKNIQPIASKDEFYDYFNPSNATPAGFAIAPWADTPETEEMIKTDLKVTPRCVPLASAKEFGKCIFTGEKAAFTIFAKGY